MNTTNYKTGILRDYHLVKLNETAHAVNVGQARVATIYLHGDMPECYIGFDVGSFTVGDFCKLAEIMSELYTQANQH